MARDFPDWLNPWSAAEGRRTFAGTVPLRRMPRLLALLHEADDAAVTERGQAARGEAQFKARFALDEEKRAVIQLSVDATVTLLCQASLEPYEQRLSRQSELGVIDSEAELELLPESYDPVLTDSGRLALVTLVEDELLLAMPQIPRNPTLEPVDVSVGDETASDETDDTGGPFAGLRDQLSGLKRRN